jgi:hypothetical protein
VKTVVRVECYSGHKADERPVRFHLGDRAYEVVEILDRWHGPDSTYFRVSTGDGSVCVLRHSREDEWTLEAYRRA